jgi:hypothetical protein
MNFKIGDHGYARANSAIGNWERQRVEREIAREEDRKLIIKSINAGYRSLAKELHPDIGGSPAAMVRLVHLRDALLANHKLPKLPRRLRNAVNRGLKQRTADSSQRRSK